ncbi:MAG: hypothetical protein QOK47_1621 [Actinomycetota bacterium]|jgi:hypothetical protein|nr:hypothetical protein [Actinomycetota bacterium]
MLVLGAAIALWIVNASHVPGVFIPQVFVVPTFGAVGAVIVAKKGHVVGWVMLSFALIGTLTAFFFEYSVAVYGGFITSLPKIALFAWLQQQLWPLNFALLGLLLLLFPDGKTVSPLFRRVLILLLVFWGLASVGGGITPTPIELLVGTHAITVANPLSIHISPTIYDGVMTAIFMCAMATTLLTAVSAIIKWRRGSPTVRQQIRWPAFVIVGTLASFILTVFLVQAGLIDAESPTALIPVLGATLALPISIGISILRYRLYEIDRIVNRAVLYASLTLVLASVYVLAIFLIREVFGKFAGSSDLEVAASTLAVAALFRPLRSRMQTFIDRRFYRRRFDAQQTLEGFNALMRDEVDLRALSGRLVGVVDETMQPAHVSLWLRPSG